MIDASHVRKQYLVDAISTYTYWIGLILYNAKLTFCVRQFDGIRVRNLQSRNTRRSYDLLSLQDTFSSEAAAISRDTWSAKRQSERNFDLRKTPRRYLRAKKSSCSEPYHKVMYIIIYDMM